MHGARGLAPLWRASPTGLGWSRWRPPRPFCRAITGEVSPTLAVLHGSGQPHSRSRRSATGPFPAGSGVLGSRADRGIRQDCASATGQTSKSGTHSSQPAMRFSYHSPKDCLPRAKATLGSAWATHVGAWANPQSAPRSVRNGGGSASRTPRATFKSEEVSPTRSLGSLPKDLDQETFRFRADRPGVGFRVLFEIKFRRPTL